MTSKRPPITADQRGKRPAGSGSFDVQLARQMQQMDEESPGDREPAENTRINITHPGFQQDR